MKNKEMIFVCNNCGNEFSKWMGQCSSCGEWNTLKEVKSLGKAIKGSTHRSTRTFEKLEVKNLAVLRQDFGSVKENGGVFSTGISEFDRVLGKGIVQGSAVLFAGEPGIGKSTLLTQLIGKIGGLYVAGEESAEQIGLRVKRLGLNANNFDILGTNSIDEIEEFLDRTKNVYKIAVVDSIQVMSSENATGVIGSVGQIKESTFRLIQIAKKKGMAIFIVGHVTKDGDIAGPKLLEHMVDTVLYFEGEKNGDLRILRTTKNRFGPTDEVGVFKMEEKGLREIKSEEINLIENGENKIGSAITVTMEGTRPMMLEIQALVVESFAPMPKRIFSGIDYNRGQLMIAIAQKSLGMPLYKYDVFLSVTGGIKIEETAADLAVLAAMWSSYKSTPNPSFDKEGRKSLPVWVGEVSLLGEVKKTRNWEKRQKEAETMGRRVVEMKNVKEIKNL
ncbi:MAG: DNA repair protein RadA [Candidatus Shapirobacteria bacterium]|nr:DNA repair protein RadA [Candidatus Shapirobacteria bacterium]